MGNLEDFILYISVCGYVMFSLIKKCLPFSTLYYLVASRKFLVTSGQLKSGHFTLGVMNYLLNCNHIRFIYLYCIKIFKNIHVQLKNTCIAFVCVSASGHLSKSKTKTSVITLINTINMIFLLATYKKESRLLITPETLVLNLLTDYVKKKNP